MTAAASPTPSTNKYSLITNILCVVITAGCSVYTSVANRATEAKIEEVKNEGRKALAESDRLAKEALSKLENETKIKLANAAILSQQNMILLQARIDSEKDAQSIRSATCKEMKIISDKMSEDLSFINNRTNITEIEAATKRLNSSANKYQAYFREAGYAATKEIMDEKTPTDSVQKTYQYHYAILSGYNREILERCSN